MDRNYWLDLFTGRTWEEFKKHGAKVTGFRSTRCQRVKDIQPGDYLLCYLTGLSRFVGVLEVKSRYYEDNTPIWEDAIFPLRFDVELLYELTPGTAVPILNLKNKLSIFKNMSSPHAWTGFFRGSPARFDPDDGRIIVEAIEEVMTNPNPITRTYDTSKYWRHPKKFDSTEGSTTQHLYFEKKRTFEDFLRMSKKEIEEAIIETLRSRPKHSCKSSDLPSQVLKHLSVRTRGTSRRKCEKHIKQRSTVLMKAKIIEEYRTSKNRRFRLIADFEVRYARYRKNLEKRMAFPSQGKVHDESEEFASEIVEPIESFFDEGNLPELPEMVDYEEDNLDILTGESTSTPFSQLNSSPPTEKHSSFERHDTLKLIHDSFVTKAGIKAKILFRELILDVILPNDASIQVTVRLYGVSNDNIIIRSQLPFSREALFDLLFLFAEPGFEGRLCVELTDNKHRLIVKKEMDLSRYSPDEVVSTIDQIIQQSYKAIEIIKRHQEHLNE